MAVRLSPRFRWPVPGLVEHAGPRTGRLSLGLELEGTLLARSGGKDGLILISLVTSSCWLELLA